MSLTVQILWLDWVIHFHAFINIISVVNPQSRRHLYKLLMLQLVDVSAQHHEVINELHLILQRNLAAQHRWIVCVYSDLILLFQFGNLILL